MDQMQSFQMANSAIPLSLTSKFILPEDKRPQLAQISSLASVPVIDLNHNGSKNGHYLLVQKISQACEEYGFFQIINHGVPQEVCDRMMSAITDFFELPPEERAEFVTEDHTKQIKVFHYNLKVEGQEKVSMWSETFSHPWHRVEDLAHLLPKNPPKYRAMSHTDEFELISEAFGEYAKEVRTLITSLFSLISEALGLEKDFLQKRLGDPPALRTQANYYPPCPNPDLTLGLAIHTDPQALTVLQQSAGVTGLQVLKDGEWVAVDPIPNAFVINLGDQMQVLSNGRFKSVHHRAVTNKTQLRVSFAMFYAPNLDTVIGPIEDLIDEVEHPPIYRSYRYAEFLQEFFRQEGKRRMVKEVFQLPK